MDYIVKDEQLVIHHTPGKGAWTYRLKIPNTKDLKGKWGDIKVSGYIDNYKLDRKNLAQIKGSVKILSVNDSIRKFIDKKAGDTLTVTLYLIYNEKLEDRNHILECFRDADVLRKFEYMKPEEQDAIINSILVLSNEDKQIEKILYFISKLTSL